MSWLKKDTEMPDLRCGEKCPACTNGKCGGSFDHSTGVRITKHRCYECKHEWGRGS